MRTHLAATSELSVASSSNQSLVQLQATMVARIRPGGQQFVIVIKSPVEANMQCAFWPCSVPQSTNKTPVYQCSCETYLVKELLLSRHWVEFSVGSRRSVFAESRVAFCTLALAWRDFAKGQRALEHTIYFRSIHLAAWRQKQSGKAESMPASSSKALDAAEVLEEGRAADCRMSCAYTLDCNLSTICAQSRVQTIPFALQDVCA